MHTTTTKIKINEVLYRYKQWDFNMETCPRSLLRDSDCDDDTLEQIMEQKCIDLQHPDTAGRLNVVRTKQFLSLDEIEEIKNAAQAMSKRNPVPKWDTVYLQNQHYFQHNHQKIYEKIKALVRDVDRQHWGLLHALDKTIGIGVNARCIEFHEYALNARRICGPHVDTGSLFTVDIMLSCTTEFEGAVFTTDRIPEEAVDANARLPHTHRHCFEQGDAIVFLSHKLHSVTPIKSGIRRVFVLEFWEGSECNGSHRCMNLHCGGMYQDIDNT